MLRKIPLLTAALCCAASLNAQTKAPYRNAVGARYDWTYNYNDNWTGLSFKHFATSRLAVEGQLLFGGDAIVPDVAVQYHLPIRPLPGLYSYVSAGLSLPFYDGKPDLLLRPGLGLDYKFPVAPLNLGFEFRPSYRLTGDDFDPFIFGRFSIPLRYTF